MKVLSLCTFELSGGAAIACNRLTSALSKHNIDTKLFVRDKLSDNNNVFAVNKGVFTKTINLLRFIWERLVILIYSKFSKKNLFAVSLANTGNDISKNKLIKEADVIHIHWINQGFLSLRDLKKLAALDKPIVWTMHDQWSYTGICHYTGGCDKFTETCSFCPMLARNGKHDFSYKTFLKKKNLFESNAFTFVGCSRWIAAEAKKSKLCRDAEIVSIPNPIDITVYDKHDKNEARKFFNLPSDKKLILFGACKVTDKRKGFDYLKALCDILYSQLMFSKEDLAIVVFGGKSNEIEALLPYHVHNAGYINDVHTMVNLYNAVDLFVIPSLEDNLPNTIMEAMSCGTPCVGFNTGGIPEMIDHKENGYIANYTDSVDLAEGVNWVLNIADYENLSANAREKVVENYNEDVIATQYIGLYNRLLNY